MQGIKLLEIMVIIDIVEKPNHLYNSDKFYLLDFFVYLKYKNECNCYFLKIYPWMCTDTYKILL